MPDGLNLNHFTNQVAERRDPDGPAIRLIFSDPLIDDALRSSFVQWMPNVPKNYVQSWLPMDVQQVGTKGRQPVAAVPDVPAMAPATSFHGLFSLSPQVKLNAAGKLLEPIDFSVAPVYTPPRKKKSWFGKIWHATVQKIAGGAAADRKKIAARIEPPLLSILPTELPVSSRREPKLTLPAQMHLAKDRHPFFHQTNPARDEDGNIKAHAEIRRLVAGYAKFYHNTEDDGPDIGQAAATWDILCAMSGNYEIGKHVLLATGCENIPARSQSGYAIFWVELGKAVKNLQLDQATRPPAPPMPVKPPMPEYETSFSPQHNIGVRRLPPYVQMGVGF
jgi:hypothetical protein